MSKRVGKTARRKQAAMDRQIGATLRAMVGEPGDNRTLMQWNPPTEPVERIAKLLLTLADQGYQPYQVFHDWCDYGCGMMRMVPLDLKRIAATGTITSRIEELPEDLRDLELRMRHRYERHLERATNIFSQALDVMLEAADQVVFDWAGTVFEHMDLSGDGGQFFTPWPLAMSMANLQRFSEQVTRMLLEALNHPDNLYGAVALIAWRVAEMLPADAQQTYFLKHVVPAAQPFIKPLAICDCACGSGRLLLAAAAHIPHWAVLGGVVNFTGMDISAVCVSMARFMANVYGLNSIGAETIVAFDAARRARAGEEIVTPMAGFTLGGSGDRNAARRWERTETGWEVVADETAAAAQPGATRTVRGRKQARVTV